MAFTNALSHEGAPHNVLVNSLHVGVIVSDQIKRRFDRERPNVSFEQYVAEAGKGCRSAAWAAPRSSPRSRLFSPRMPPRI
jgi:NAD(P)-dependent dehydrogenase (short-subunit alcohol dehydrogenase family)